jgi:hypothetical protein
MSRHVLNFLTGQNPKAWAPPLPAEADIIGEGYFYKEGTKIKTWKYRKFTVFNNGNLMYFSPMRKLFKGMFQVSEVSVSVPARRGRPIDIVLGDGAFEMHLKSPELAKPLILLFKTDEEAMLFLYYISVACKTLNVMVGYSTACLMKFIHLIALPFRYFSILTFLLIIIIW